MEALAIEEMVRKVAMSIPPSDFGSGRAIKAMAEALAPLTMLEDAVAISDAAEKACPVNKGRCAFNDRCPICGAAANETCFRTAAADYRAMQMVRRALRTLGGAQAPAPETGAVQKVSADAFGKACRIVGIEPETGENPA